MTLLRLLLIVVLLVVIGAFVMGYLGNRGSREVVALPGDAGSSEAASRAREGAAQIGEKAGEAASAVTATLEEAALTTKIKAKMALDDLVKARSIDVTTRGTTVTLSGVVESKAEHDRAMTLASETEGVTDVIDNMKMLQPAG